MSAPMDRFRKVSPRFWDDESVLQFQEGEKLLVLYLITSRQTNRIGTYKLSVGMAAEDIGCSTDTLKGRLETVTATLGWEFDPSTRVLRISTWFKYNSPANPNVLQSWGSDWRELPECQSKSLVRKDLEEFAEGFGERCMERFQEWFPEPSSKRLAQPGAGAGAGEGEEQPYSRSSLLDDDSDQREEIRWRVDRVWEAFLRQRQGFYESRDGRPPGAVPKLTQQRRRLIRDAIHRHDDELLEFDQRAEWTKRSRVRAAAIGLFLDEFMTGNNERQTAYLEPERPFRVKGGVDQVDRFADLFFNTKNREGD